MSRLLSAWRELSAEQRLAGLAAVSLLVTMFFPWYGLQSVNARSPQIYSHTINAFGDVSFVEAAIFLVAAGVVAMLFARGERRDFQLPGGDGTVVMLAGGWAALLIFYRVFSRPSGHGYPVGIEWGFFLAFVAAGALAYAGWRMRVAARPHQPAARPRRASSETDETRATAAVARRPRTREAAPTPATPGAARRSGPPGTAETRVRPAPESAETQVRPAAAPSSPPGSGGERPPYPPAPPGQLSFEEDPPPRAQ